MILGHVQIIIVEYDDDIVEIFIPKKLQNFELVL